LAGAWLRHVQHRDRDLRADQVELLRTGPDDPSRQSRTDRRKLAPHHWSGYRCAWRQRLERAPTFLAAWQARTVYQRDADGLFFIGQEVDGTNQAIDPDTGEAVEAITRDGFSQLRPNGGVRSMIGAALVQFQLSDPNPATRREALDAIARDAEESHLGALRASLDGEDDPTFWPPSSAWNAS
jgi:hypothetical protein